MDKRIEDIFEMNSIMENTFFSDLDKILTIPKSLNATHIKAMVIISSNELQSMSKVSRKLNLEKGSFTPVANKLIDIGYIEKIKCTEDKRASYLVLTESGKDFVAHLIDSIGKHINSKLNKLSKEEKEAYFSCIKIILNYTTKINE